MTDTRKPERAFFGRTHMGRSVYGPSSRHGAQGEPASGSSEHPLETPVPGPLPTDEETPR